MKNLLEKWKRFSKEETRRFLKFLAFPLVVIILIIVVVLFDKSGKVDTNESAAVSASVESSASVDESKETESEKLEIKLEKESIPKIHDLMEDYFKARRTCDIKAFSKVYGGAFSKEELNELADTMEEEVKFYQNFENLECYLAPGVTDGEYLVYAKVDIKFRQAETLAPSLIICYAKISSDGNYYLVANTNDKQSQYIEDVNQSEQVDALIKEVNQHLDQVLKSDKYLLAVYHILMDKKPEQEGIDESESTNESQVTETTVAESSSKSDNS